MSLIDELRLFVTSLSEPGEAKKNKEALNKIISRYKNKKGECTFCGNELNLKWNKNT